ncbi:hypothetical protein D018_2303B, partial [Vibrio parahaemolyticus VP2007-007]
RNAF